MSVSGAERSPLPSVLSSADVDIALFVPVLTGGGAERVMVTLANEFGKRCLTVDMVLAEASGPYLQDVHHTVRVVDLRAAGVPQAILPLAGYLRKQRPKVLLSTLKNANLAAILAKTLARGDTRVFVREAAPLSPWLEGATSFKAKVYPPLMRTLYRKADGVIANSFGTAEDIAGVTGLAPERIEVIYNPVATAEISAKAQEPSPHPWLVCKEVPVVLAVGRLTELKGFHTLIRAVALLKRRVECRLIILGEGEQRAELERSISQLGLERSVDLPGFVSNPFSYVKQADVFVLSSLWEGFGMVIAEALSVGTPVVATDCPSGPAEILERGRHGRLVPVGDPEAMALAIEKTINHPPDRELLKARAEAFSVEHIIPQYLQVLGFDA